MTPSGIPGPPDTDHRFLRTHRDHIPCHHTWGPCIGNCMSGRRHRPGPPPHSTRCRHTYPICPVAWAPATRTSRRAQIGRCTRIHRYSSAGHSDHSIPRYPVCRRSRRNRYHPDRLPGSWDTLRWQSRARRTDQFHIVFLRTGPHSHDCRGRFRSRFQGGSSGGHTSHRSHQTRCSVPHSYAHSIGRRYTRLLATRIHHRNPSIRRDHTPFPHIWECSRGSHTHHTSRHRP